MPFKLNCFFPGVEVHIAATLTMKAHVIAFLLQLDDNLRRTLGLMVIDPDTHEGKAVLGSVSLEVHQVDVLIRGGAVNLADPVRLTAAVDLHVRRDAAPSVGGSVIMHPAVLLSSEGFLFHCSGSLLFQIVMDDHETALVIQQLEAVTLTTFLLDITDKRIKGGLLLLGEIRQLLFGENHLGSTLSCQLPDRRVQLIRKAHLPLVHEGRDEIGGLAGVPVHATLAQVTAGIGVVFSLCLMQERVKLPLGEACQPNAVGHGTLDEVKTFFMYHKLDVMPLAVLMSGAAYGKEYRL